MVVFEFVPAVALGLALAHARVGAWNQDAIDAPMTQQFEAPKSIQVAVATESFFIGVVLVGGLATWVERLRGRSPRPWAPGRWVWSILALFILLANLQGVTDYFAINVLARRDMPGHPFFPFLPYMKFNHGQRFLEITPRLLLALGLTYLVAGARSSAPPDAREITGRVLAALIIALGFVVQTFRLLGYPMAYVGGDF
jgi:hypothetical protein